MKAPEEISKCPCNVQAYIMHLEHKVDVLESWLDSEIKISDAYLDWRESFEKHKKETEKC